MSPSEETDSKPMNSLVHFLNPQKFIRLRMFTKCATEENLQEILKSICALRNSGGGRLTIWLTETCSRSDAEKCMEIIKDAVDEVLSDTSKTNLLEFMMFLNRIIFYIKDSKEIVTMKYNMYIMTSEVAQLVPSTKSAAEVRRLLQTRKQQPTTKYNISGKTNETAKLVVSAKSNANVRLLTGRSKQLKHDDITEPTVREISHQKMPRAGFYGGTNECVTNYSTMQHPCRLSPISHFPKDEQVEILTKYDSTKAIRFQVLKNTSTAETKVANLILRRENRLREHVNYLAEHFGGHVYYGISSDGIVCGVNMDKKERRRIRKIVKNHILKINIHNARDIKVYLRCVKDKNRKDIANLFVIGIYIPPPRAGRREHRLCSGLTDASSFDNFPIPRSLLCTSTPEIEVEEKSLDHVEVTKGEKVGLHVLNASESVKFKTLDDNQFKSVAHPITLDENELLKYVCGFANHKGGELYYGYRISSDGIVVGELLQDFEIQEISDEIEKKIESMQVWPRCVQKIHKFWEIFFIPVRDENDSCPRRFVIKIDVNPYRGGVFVEDPESYHVVENAVEKFPFFEWTERLHGPTLEVSDETIRVEFTGKINIKVRINIFPVRTGLRTYCNFCSL